MKLLFASDSAIGKILACIIEIIHGSQKYNLPHTHPIENYAQVPTDIITQHLCTDVLFHMQKDLDDSLEYTK